MSERWLFYEEDNDDEKWQQAVAKLPWGYNLLLIDKINDKYVRKRFKKNLMFKIKQKDILEWILRNILMKYINF